MNTYQPLSASSFPHQAILKWLMDFQDAVCREDYDTGRELFHKNVMAFGTITERADCLDQLIDGQWRKRWPRNVDFRFHDDQAFVLTLEDGAHLILTSWSTRPDEECEDSRTGRATLLLKDCGKGLLCLHSHFSLVPCLGNFAKSE